MLITIDLEPYDKNEIGKKSVAAVSDSLST
jgi:hypothetical protein